MLHRSIYFLGILLLAFSSCHNKQEERKSEGSVLKTDSLIKYARRFAISQGQDLIFVYLYGNRNNYDTTARFVLYTDSNNLGDRQPDISYIKLPCKRIAALSSIYAAMFCELGALDNVAAIDNIDYVNSAEVIQKFKTGQLPELARTPQIDLERTVTLNPDIIFTFGMGDWEKDTDKKLAQTGIPVAMSVDHLEESPLARAEWIKFFAVFVNKQQQADSIFKSVEKNYFKLKSIAASAQTKPTVFSEIKYSDSWYMPGGKSYVAQLFHDAGADYLWKNDSKTGSLPLSFEQVYARAKDGDFWVNLSILKTKKELLGYESRYSEFKAYKNGNLFNNTKTTNSFGYSNYWETGMIYPDRILGDLIQIFHQDLKSEINRDFYYYEQIK